MRIEKRATNKVGLVLLILLVVSALAGGGYYLLKHKDSLKIDWNFSVPWDKNSEKKQEEKKKKSGKNSNVAFTKPDGYVSVNFNLQNSKEGVSDFCQMEFEDAIEEKDNYVILPYKVSSTEKGNAYPDEEVCSISINRYVIDGFQISGNSKVSIKGGETKKGEVKLLLPELESQDLRGMTNAALYYKWEEKNRSNPSTAYIGIEFKNIKHPKNNISGVQIDDIIPFANLEVLAFYYDTKEDADNTYLYFIFEERAGTDYTSTFKIKKLLINDKIYNVKDFSKSVGTRAKTIAYITIPKDDIKKVNKFSISFIIISELDKNSKKYDKTKERIVYSFTNDFTNDYDNEIK